MFNNGVRVDSKHFVGATTLVLGLSFGSLCAAKHHSKPFGAKAKLGPIKVGERQERENVHRFCQDQDFPQKEPQDKLNPRKPESKPCRACLRPSAFSKHGDIKSHESAHEFLSAKIKNSQDLYQSLLLRGGLLLELTLYEKARKDFEVAINLKRASFEAYLGRGKAFAGLGDFEKAEGDFTKAIGLNAAKPTAYRERARLFRAQGKLREAHADFNVASRRDGKDTVIIKELATILEEMNKFDDAQKLYSQLEEKGSRTEIAIAWFALKRLGTLTGQPYTKAAPFNKLNPEKPELFILQAQLHFQSKEFAKAKAALNTALIQLRREGKKRDHFRAWRELKARVPSPSAQQYKEALALLVLVRCQLGEKSVETDLKELQRIGSNSSEAALAQSLMSKTLKSIDLYSQCLDTDSSITARTFQRAQFPRQSSHDHTLRYRGKKQTHCLPLTRLLYLNPWHYQARFERAKACFKESHELTRVNSDLKSILALQPQHWEARVLWARSLHKQGSGESLKSAREQLGIVLQQLEKSSELFKSADRQCDWAEVYFERAMLSQNQALSNVAPDTGNSCLADLTKAIQRAPKDTARGLNLTIECYRARGREQKRLGKEAEGDKDLKSAELYREDAKRRGAVYFRKAMKNQSQRRYPESIKLFNLSLDFDRSQSEAFYSRGLSYLKIGNFIPGILDMAKAVELNHRYGRSFANKIYQVSYVVDLKRVIKELDICIAQFGDGAHVWFLRGFFHMARVKGKDLDDTFLALAENDMSKATKLNPNFVSAHENLALILIKRGRLKAAQRELKKTRELAPDNWTVAFYEALLVAKTVPLQGTDAKRDAAIANGKSLLKAALKHRPLLAKRAERERELKLLFVDEFELKAFIKTHSARK